MINEACAYWELKINLLWSIKARLGRVSYWIWLISCRICIFVHNISRLYRETLSNTVLNFFYWRIVCVVGMHVPVCISAGYWPLGSAMPLLWLSCWADWALVTVGLLGAAWPDSITGLHATQKKVLFTNMSFTNKTSIFLYMYMYKSHLCKLGCDAINQQSRIFFFNFEYKILTRNYKRAKAKKKMQIASDSF